MDFSCGELAEDLRSLVATVVEPAADAAPDDTAPSGAAWQRLQETGLLQAFLPAARKGENAGAEELVAVVRELGLGGARIPAVGAIPALMVSLSTTPWPETGIGVFSINWRSFSTFSVATVASVSGKITTNSSPP